MNNSEGGMYVPLTVLFNISKVFSFGPLTFLFMASYDDAEMQDVRAGGWAKLSEAWEQVKGVFKEYFIKPAKDQFGEQIVAVIENDQWTHNVPLSGKNAMYVNTIKALRPGHVVSITLEWFWNGEAKKLENKPGKTKMGVSYAKSFRIQESAHPYQGAAAATDVF